MTLAKEQMRIPATVDTLSQQTNRHVCIISVYTYIRAGNLNRHYNAQMCVCTSICGGRYRI